ncbi:MAG: hypothetical protein MI796_09600 [Enterobacterales bacterium]|nr:hypothetical protein [Enterobacterales bacterium]
MALNVCFDLVCDECLLFSEVAKLLKQDRYTLTGFAMGNRWSSARLPFSKIYKINSSLSETSIEKELERIQSRYEFEPISKYIMSDRFLIALSDSEVNKIVVSTFLAIEEIIEDGVDVFVTTGVAYFYNLALLAVSKYNNVNCISLYGARLSESRFTFSTGKGGRWDSVENWYKEFLASGSVERKYVDYVSSQRKQALKPDYMNSAFQKGGIGTVFIKEFFQRLHFWFIDKWGQEGDYITQSPFWYMRRDLKRYLKKAIFRKHVKFANTESRESYFLYPMHLQPEASTLILGKNYFDQLNTIKQIARCLPLGCKLYVKEHPAAFGRHSVRFYKEIEEIYGVKLIAPWEDSQDLILKSKGVIVISGTMGWEALLLGRPSIVLGDVFFDSFTGVYKVSDLEELQKLLHSDSLKQASLHEAAMAVQSLYKGSFPGFFYPHKLDMRDRVLSRENVECFRHGLKEIINESLS